MTTQINAEELKKLLRSEDAIIGTERTLKGLKAGKIKKILIASNCNDRVEKMIEYYVRVSKTELIRLSYPNDELGSICKKPFSISVIGLRV